MDVRKLSDEVLIAKLDKCVEIEIKNESEMIDFIREVMSRRLYIKYGADSMFDFLTRAHYHFAPSVAQRKLDAARLMQVFPDVKELLLKGDVNLTQLGMLVSAFRQKPVPLKVQRQIIDEIQGQTIGNTQIILNEALEIKAKKRANIRVQRDGSVRVEVTFSKEDWEIITRAKEVVSHSVPSGEIDQVLTYCARVTLSKKDPTTAAKEVKPRQCQGVARGARRFVFRRDQTCRFRHADGRICGSRYQLQVDHIQSRSAGGGNNVENLQLLCGVHNRHKYESRPGHAHCN